MTRPIAQLYAELSAAVHNIGPHREEVRKSSVLLIRTEAFASVHPRKAHLLITFYADSPVDSPRILRAERVANNRWHMDVKLMVSGDIDDELIGWLRNAYQLCG